MTKRERQQYNRRYYKQNKNKILSHVRKSHLPRTYDVTEDKFEEMNLKQNGVCAICVGPEKRKYKGRTLTRLSVDHNHKSKRVRGLLCHDCNLMLGKAHDSIEILRSAISYLERS